MRIASAGDIAGCKVSRPDGTRCCYSVKVNGKVYRVHRIVYSLHHGDIPEGYVVDHIDRNPWNNIITNLRCVTQGQNNKNRSMQNNNSTGFTGVAWVVNPSGSTSAVAYVRRNGRLSSKVFNTRKLGLLPAFKKACEWRVNQLLEVNKEESPYTETHGIGSRV